MEKSIFEAMKRILGLMLIFGAFSVAFSCVTPDDNPGKSPVVLDEGTVGLVDQEFGMYYGDKNNNLVGVYTVVLSDAVCYRDGYGQPYLDSEGDMLVLEFNTELQDPDAVIRIPAGDYPIDDTKSGSVKINTANSYVKRLVGNTQYHYNFVSGTFVVEYNDEGGYEIRTEELVIEKAGEEIEVQYTYSGSLKFDEWAKVAVTLQTVNDDIIDMPMTEVSAAYYGNLFGYGTGNFVINLSTDGFVSDETGALPGVLLTFNMFDELVPKDHAIILNEGTYTVYPSFLPDQYAMLSGMNMDGMPFGTYLFQVDANGAQALEYISKGTVEVKQLKGDYNDVYTFVYDLETPTRKVKGQWTGPVEFADVSTDSDRVILSTLDGDVECDMYRVESARLEHIETLKTTPLPSVDVAEAWQLWLQPRMWTDEEMKLPWDERIKVWNPNGDIMIFEFVLPLGSNGNLAPEKDKEYSYQIQPNLAMEEVLYGQSVSKMGRPYDDIFYEPNWKDYTYMTGTDARRGFTWDGGFRGNWYLHYIEGTWQNMDETAPAVKGTVKVTRLSEYTMATGGGRQADMKIVWDLYDDAEASYNITGEWTGPVVVSTGGEL